jgi:hypothetical protein
MFTLSLFALEGLLGWLEFQTPTLVLLRVIFEGLLSALGIGFAEELVFRGWLLDELQRDYTQKASLWIDAIAFAILHFLKPFKEVIRTFPAFPGLLLLGLTLVWAKQSRKGRLGLPIGLHAGLVWGYYIINVGQLVQYSGNVSPWITGVDRNPVARGEASAESDIDFLIDVGVNHSRWFPGGLLADLEDLLGCKVDIVTENGLHRVIRERVLKEAVPL